MKNRSSLAGNSRGHLSLGPALANTAIPPFTFLKFHERFQQPRPIEIRPQCLGHENLGVSNLPQQKIADPHLAASTNQQVRIRQSVGIEPSRKIFLSNRSATSLRAALRPNRV